VGCTGRPRPRPVRDLPDGASLQSRGRLAGEPPGALGTSSAPGSGSAARGARPLRPR